MNPPLKSEPTVSDRADLRARLDAFQFESAFVHKLARENAWTRAHAERACAEYKRFVFLALAAGHPCAPSDAVDQVWHQHLLHTEDYWGRFCPYVLGAPLHHQPGGSAAGDGDKFRTWYRNTLASYQRIFGEAAPEHVWPSPARYLEGDFRRLDQRKLWLVRKPRWWARLAQTYARTRWPRRRVVALALASLAAAGCSLIRDVPPFDMRGPSFLLLFIAVWAASALVVVVLRGMPRGKIRTGDVHAYELAYLVGGDWQVVQAISAALLEAGRVKLSDAGRLVATSKGLQIRSKAPKELARLEEAVVQCCLSSGAEGASLGSLPAVIADYRAELIAGLTQKRMLYSAGERWLFLGLMSVAPLLGLVKIGVGLSLGKPVGLLVMLCFLSAFLALWWPRRVPQATPHGRELISTLRQGQVVQAGAPILSDLPLATSVALFGAGALAHGAFAELERSLVSAEPLPRKRAAWGAGESSSDSSWWSSDSSSSSCSSDSSSSSSDSSGGSSCSSSSCSSSSSSGCGGCSSSSSSCSSSSSSD